jgi:hypothetical protein
MALEPDGSMRILIPKKHHETSETLLLFAFALLLLLIGTGTIREVIA